MSTDWNKATIGELRKALSERGLDLAGKKTDLLARLKEYEEQNAEEEVEETEEVEEEVEETEEVEEEVEGTEEGVEQTEEVEEEVEGEQGDAEENGMNETSESLEQGEEVMEVEEEVEGGAKEDAAEEESKVAGQGAKISWSSRHMVLSGVTKVEKFKRKIERENIRLPTNKKNNPPLPVTNRLMVFPITFEDFKNELLSSVLANCARILTTSYPMKNEDGETEFKTLLNLYFKKESDVTESIPVIEAFKEGINTYRSSGKTDKGISDFNAKFTAYAMGDPDESTASALFNFMPTDLTEEDLWQVFPKADRIIVDTQRGTNTRTVTIFFLSKKDREDNFAMLEETPPGERQKKLRFFDLDELSKPKLDEKEFRELKNARGRGRGRGGIGRGGAQAAKPGVQDPKSNSFQDHNSNLRGAMNNAVIKLKAQMADDSKPKDDEGNLKMAENILRRLRNTPFDQELKKVSYELSQPLFSMGYKVPAKEFKTWRGSGKPVIPGGTQPARGGRGAIRGARGAMSRGRGGIPSGRGGMQSVRGGMQSGRGGMQSGRGGMQSPQGSMRGSRGGRGAMQRGRGGPAAGRGGQQFAQKRTLSPNPSPMWGSAKRMRQTSDSYGYDSEYTSPRGYQGSSDNYGSRGFRDDFSASRGGFPESRREEDVGGINPGVLQSLRMIISASKELGVGGGSSDRGFTGDNRSGYGGGGGLSSSFSGPSSDRLSGDFGGNSDRFGSGGFAGSRRSVEGRSSGGYGGGAYGGSGYGRQGRNSLGGDGYM